MPFFQVCFHEFAFNIHEVVSMPIVLPSDAGFGVVEGSRPARQRGLNGSGFAETTTQDFARFWCITEK